MNSKAMNHLAAITVCIGVNVQKGQPVLINAPIECMDFARILASAAYTAGAGEVFVNYADSRLSRMRYDNVTLDRLTDIPQWQIDRYHWYLDKGAAVISIHAEDPTVMEGVDTDKVQAVTKAIQSATSFYHQAIITNGCRWCVISVPTPGWAKKVFPEYSEAEAVDALWEAIFKATRTDLENPVAAWRSHDDAFKQRSEFLNQKQFKQLRYKNALGTDFTIGMPENHVWTGGSEVAKDGVNFFPNIPTEEIFSAPHKDTANGTLVAASPLVYNGQLIDGFSLTFKDGAVISFKAERGQEALESLINSCPGSNRLGEIALVPACSPIAESGILFYNTLFDENASCHFALGSCYPECVKNGGEMSETELEAAGLNQSDTHVDFMIGTKDLSIIGIDENGVETPIFIDGNFNPEL